MRKPFYGLTRFLLKELKKGNEKVSVCADSTKSVFVSD